MNSTPLWRKCALRPWCYALYSSMTSRHGATFAASLTSKLADSALLGYLRRRSLCELRRESQQISPSQPKEKYGTPEWVFPLNFATWFLSKLEAKSLNSTPLWRKCAMPTWCYALRSSLTSRHGATFAASLTSKLADSALLGYLRRRSLCELRRESQQISPSQPKEKYGTPEWVFRIFGGEREI
ncbi:MAG: hypothetical protein IJY23_02640 [Clostridia bacterium]|nr:hypothetical protein [Clostridia bacterium]